MPVIKTSGWMVKPTPESRFVDMYNGVRLPVFVRPFVAPNEGYAIVYPQGRLSPDLWKSWIGTCQRSALFDPQNKYWVWTNLTLEKVSLPNEASAPTDNVHSLTKAEREELKRKRKESEKKFNDELLELSKAENIPEELWNNYQYPAHYSPPSSTPSPTALQRIIVRRYWEQPYSLIGASVGTGKTRMVIDILNARALAPNNSPLNDSARIVLVVAPLALHENWRREFAKWSPRSVRWDCHRFAPTKQFWNDAEVSATALFDGVTMRTGGLVIICTPNALSRKTLAEQFQHYGYVPTCIVVDEVQRFFRKPDNQAFKTLMQFRRHAHAFISLSGTPTSKFEDWWALEDIMSGGQPSSHWRYGTYLDYQRLGDVGEHHSSGLYQKGWSFERGIKEYHANRIKVGSIFMADKNYYMKDSLPGLDQEELGDFADMRLSFMEMVNNFPEYVGAAMDLQRKESGSRFTSENATAFANVLLLRMRQVAAMAAPNKALLKQFVEEFLDDGEPCVFWGEFRNEPANQLQETVDFLNQYGPTAYVMGGMDATMRQEGIDGFQNGKYRFQVCQTDAGGVGITLTRACKCLFLTVPLGYLTTTQCIGRLHRIGQTNDVTSYFAMTSPIAAFARAIYDRRAELNEFIPQQMSGVLKQIVDSEPVAA